MTRNGTKYEYFKLQNIYTSTIKTYTKKINYKQ